MKIAILHDYFDKRGGGERLVINLARALNADIYTGYIDREKTFGTRGVKVFSLDVKGKPQLYRNIRIAKKFESLKLSGYDAYIFSGVWCISAARNNHPNMLYLHTPLRAIYDLKQHFLEKSNPAARIVLRKFASYWVPKDRRYMEEFDIIGTNSENVKKRVLKFYGKEIYKKTTAVYTGIETKRYKYVKSGNFYLSAARLDTLKRIDMIIRAFKKMPDKKLVIAGRGPDEKRLKKIADGCNNITFLGGVGDKKLLHLYATCRATIAANMDEDLGLIAIESHASGKPVISIREGGFLETVNKKNGVFFSNGEEIPSAVETLERRKWNHKTIQESSKRFDIKVFKSRVNSMIDEAVKRYENR